LKTRLLVGFSVFGLIILSGYGIWLESKADKLTRYTPADTVLYLWLDLNDTQKHWAGTKLLNNLLSNVGLKNFDRHLLNRQIAEICWPQNKVLACGLIIKVNDSQKAIAEFDTIKTPYKKIGPQTFLVAKNPDWLKSYSRQNNLLVSAKLQKKPWTNSPITLYLSATKNLPNDLAKTLSLSLANQKSLRLCGQAQGASLIFSPDYIFRTDHLFPNTAPKNQVDIIINAKQPQKAFTPLYNQEVLNNLRAMLASAYNINPASSLWLKLANEPQTIIIGRNNDSENILTAHTFWWQVKNTDLNNEEKAELEKTFTTALARETPSIKTVSLTDGTTVAELFPDSSKVNRTEENNLINFQAADLRLSYENSNNKLTIYNSSTWLTDKNPLMPENYLFLRLPIIAPNFLNSSFRDFDILEYNSNRLYFY